MRGAAPGVIFFDSKNKAWLRPLNAPQFLSISGVFIQTLLCPDLDPPLTYAYAQVRPDFGTKQHFGFYFSTGSLFLAEMFHQSALLKRSAF